MSRLYEPKLNFFNFKWASFISMIGMLIGTLLLLPSYALSAEKRVALVIGNGDYKYAPALKNSHNDATQISTKLSKLGFEVIEGLDLDQDEFAATLSKFAQALQGADSAMLYYAGHGIQLDGRNYLISTNAKMESSFTLYGETIPLDEIIRLMESYSPINLAFLDACRNNPFLEKLQSSLPGTRSGAVHRGLAPIKSSKKDTLLMFATSSNEVAEDGSSDHSPFAAALINHLATPNVEVSRITKRIIRDVREATNLRQKPEVLSAMSAEYYFNPQFETPDEDSIAYEKAKAINTGSAWRQFILKHPDGFFNSLARRALKKLEEEGRVFNPEIAFQNVESALELTLDERKKIQNSLNLVGYDVGGIDGQFGPVTRRMLARFQHDWMLMPTGYVDPTTYATIFSEEVKNQIEPVANESNNLSAVEVEELLELGKADRVLVVKGLHHLGYLRVYPAHGNEFSQNVRKAIKAFQNDRNANSTGYLNATQKRELWRAGRAQENLRLRKLNLDEIDDRMDPRLKALVRHYKNARYSYAYFGDTLYVNVKLSFGGSWDEAREFSESIGGHLVVFSSSAERKFIDDHLRQDLTNFHVQNEWFEGPAVGYYQLGSATRSENGWTSVTGEAVRNLSWFPFQPNELMLANSFGFAVYGGEINDRFGRWKQRQKDLKFADQIRFKQFAKGFVFEFPPINLLDYPALNFNDG